MTPEDPAIFLARVLANLWRFEIKLICKDEVLFGIGGNVGLRIRAIDQDPDLAPGVAFEVHLCVYDGPFDSSLPPELVNALMLLRPSIDEQNPS
jgi:hypothetical protein